MKHFCPPLTVHTTTTLTLWNKSMWIEWFSPLWRDTITLYDKQI